MGDLYSVLGRSNVFIYGLCVLGWSVCIVYTLNVVLTLRSIARRGKWATRIHGTIPISG